MKVKQAIKFLYIGKDPISVRFRYTLILFDAATIIFFVATAHGGHGPGITLVSMIVGLIILMDFSARLWISKDRKRLLRKIYTLADIVVILSLILDPFLRWRLRFNFRLFLQLISICCSCQSLTISIEHLMTVNLHVLIAHVRHRHGR